MTIVLTEEGMSEVQAERGLSLSAADAERVTGWSAKPEGMCRGEVCVPWPAAADGRIDVKAFWERLGHPVLHDDAEEVWVLGTGADARAEALAGLEAPELALPDFAGKPRRLSDLRGKKVFLVTWASW